LLKNCESEINEKKRKSNLAVEIVEKFLSFLIYFTKINSLIIQNRLKSEKYQLHLSDNKIQ